MPNFYKGFGFFYAIFADICLIFPKKIYIFVRNSGCNTHKKSLPRKIGGGDFEV